MNYLNNLWDLFVDMSFYIVIGLIFTGILHAFINKDAILKHVGKKSTSSVIKASVLGVPLPLCSCGVVPTALYLGKSGASKGAVVSFLTSTPQTGVDSIIATYGLIGPLFAAYRAIAAFISGIFSGIIVNIFCQNDAIYYSSSQESCGCSSHNEPVVSSCSCSSPNEAVVSSCGCSDESALETPISFSEKLKTVFTYAFGDFLDEIARNFIIGLLIAAMITTLVPESWLSNFTSPLLSMLVMLIIGIPMYICSTASIPIALSLMLKGVSPGSAFVFLFAGPFTNIASLAILGKSLGRKVLIIYLGCAAICSIAFGFLLDFIIDFFNYQGLSHLAEHSHEHETPFYMIVIAIAFGLLLLRSLFFQYFKKKTHPTSCCSGN